MPYSPDTVQKRVNTPLGPVRLAASAHGLCGLWFEGQRHAPASLDGSSAWPMADDHAVLHHAAEQLATWLAAERHSFDLPLDISCGTQFQQNVWRALLDLDWGRTCSYGDLARMVGSPSAVRAVGAAVGRNPLSLVVPCHRVLGAGGALTGYAGGLERKRALLEMEAGHAFPGTLDSTQAVLSALQVDFSGQPA